MMKSVVQHLEGAKEKKASISNSTQEAAYSHMEKEIVA